MTSNIQYKTLYTIVLVLLIGSVFKPASADTLSLPLGKVTVIRSGEVNRIRLGLDITPLQNTRVDYAEILMPHFLTEGEIVLEGWRLNSENSDDYDTTYYVRYATGASINTSF